MSSTTSTNPAVQAIIAGTAPHQARLAAASGFLPLPQAVLLEVLVVLQDVEDSEIAEAARETLASQAVDDLLTAARSGETSPAVLGYLAGFSKDNREIHEAIVLTYMKMLEKPKGVIINFHCTNIFKEGQKTLVNEYYAALPKI